MTNLQKIELYKNSFEGKEFEIIGNVIEITPIELKLHVLISGHATTFIYKYNSLFTKSLINYNIGDLVICIGVCKGINFNETYFEFSNIYIYSGVTDEEIEINRIKKSEQRSLIWALLFAVLTALFVSIGGWWWIAAILCGFVALMLFEAAKII